MCRSANGESWIRASRRTYRPCESTFKDCSLKSSWSLTRIRTPLLWLVPWEKNVLPFHCFFHSFSTSGVLYVSWRKHISAEDLNSQLKIDFLLSKERIPRAFNDKSLKFMFWCPMTDEIICKLQMREANANGSFEQQAISSLSRV